MVQLPEKESSRKRDYALLLTLIVLAIVVAGVIYFSPVIFGTPTRSGVVTTPTNTTTVPHTPTDYVYVRVVSDYNVTPIEGVEFTGEPGTIQNGVTTWTTIGIMGKTNSSGLAYFQWHDSNVMMFKTEYQGKTYNFTVPMFVGENYAVLSLPSGKVTTASVTITSTVDVIFSTINCFFNLF
jgi:hypothetical protein